MNRIYVYQLTDKSLGLMFKDFADRNRLEVDIYRKSLSMRVPTGCLHSLFVLRFGDAVRLVDKTWEIGHHY